MGNSLVTTAGTEADIVECGSTAETLPLGDGTSQSQGRKSERESGEKHCDELVKECG